MRVIAWRPEWPSLHDVADPRGLMQRDFKHREQPADDDDAGDHRDERLDEREAARVAGTAAGVPDWAVTGKRLSTL